MVETVGLTIVLEVAAPAAAGVPPAAAVEAGGATETAGPLKLLPGGPGALMAPGAAEGPTFEVVETAAEPTGRGCGGTTGP